MPWILGCLPPREPESLEYFFSVLGRALYSANTFEGKCRHILRLIRLAGLFEQEQDVDAALQLAAAFKDKMLAGTLADISTRITVHAADIELLEKAKDARNFIAHEGGAIGSMMDASEHTITEQLELLRSHVKALAKGDNLASLWEYEICEKEPAPIGTCEFYPPALEEWIFGGAAQLDAGRLYYERHIASQSR